jgi:metacaspase-1
MQNPQGLSLHVGLNEVEPAHYRSKCELAGCVGDGEALQTLAQQAGLVSLGLLTDARATRNAVADGIREAAGALESGDYFLFSFSGHGAQIPDFNRDETKDSLDETWCLFDGMMIDDEVDALWTLFRPGVRVLALLDCCHAGTSLRTAPPIENIGSISPERKARCLSLSAAARIFDDHRGFYKSLQQSTSLEVDGPKQRIKASIRFISGCHANQLALDGWDNGAFTKELLTVWKGGEFKGDHGAFHRAIGARMHSTQTPSFSALGARDPTFDCQRPFTV